MTSAFARKALPTRAGGLSVGSALLSLPPQGAHLSSLPFPLHHRRTIRSSRRMRLGSGSANNRTGHRENGPVMKFLRRWDEGARMPRSAGLNQPCAASQQLHRLAGTLPATRQLPAPRLPGTGPSGERPLPQSVERAPHSAAIPARPLRPRPPPRSRSVARKAAAKSISLTSGSSWRPGDQRNHARGRGAHERFHLLNDQNPRAEAAPARQLMSRVGLRSRSVHGKPWKPWMAAATLWRPFRPCPVPPTSTCGGSGGHSRSKCPRMKRPWSPSYDPITRAMNGQQCASRFATAFAAKLFLLASAGPAPSDAPPPAEPGRRQRLENDSGFRLSGIRSLSRPVTKTVRSPSAGLMRIRRKRPIPDHRLDLGACHLFNLITVSGGVSVRW